MQNKKDSIREYLLKCKDGYNFTTETLLDRINRPTLDNANVKTKITQKDIGNVTRELLKSAALTRTRKDKEFVYTVDQNAMALHFAKHPFKNRLANKGKQKVPLADISGKPKPEGGFFGSPLPTRRHNRPPMVRAIDEEIAMHAAKIKKLQIWRKEYMT